VGKKPAEPELEFLKSLWGLGTEEVIVPARQATEAGGIHSLESIPGLFKNTGSECFANFYIQYFCLCMGEIDCIA
jgi:hypothetical protein